MKDFCKATTIHTRISPTIRISSIYRHWGNENFSSDGWETFVWDGKEIKEQFDSNDYDECMGLHKTLYEKYTVAE